MSSTIRLDGSTRRSFLFPAPPEDAFAYYLRPAHIFFLLPHITLVEQLDDDVYRLLYHSTELNIYRVHLYCDLRLETEAASVLRFVPLPESSPIEARAGIDWLRAPGFYTSTSIFRPMDGQQTAIEYSLHLWADLPRPFGLWMLPNGTMNRIANAITRYRIDEIANGFIERSIADYLQP
ncbi:MAG: hypothetical protein Fur0018_01390 [Anaerolineales bacterium]